MLSLSHESIIDILLALENTELAMGPDSVFSSDMSAVEFSDRGLSPTSLRKV
jgi:hypothetical protein